MKTHQRLSPRRSLRPLAILTSLLFAVSARAAYTPADPMRFTAWNPGLNAVGGIPDRTTVFRTIEASAHGNGAADASTAIQAALNACPVGQIVQLSAGTFTVNTLLLINKGVTLRGAGPGRTILQKTNGAVLNSYNPPDSQPLVIIGPTRWEHPDDTTATNLAVDGAKGAFTATLANASGFAPGQIVLLDELSGAGWQPDRQGPGQVYASPDYRVTWKLHNPAGADDPLTALTPTPGHPETTGGAAATWFSRQDRPTAEAKEIVSVVGNVVTFSTPLHIDYRVSHLAQLTRYYDAAVAYAGVESLTATGGSSGAIVFAHAAYSWAKDVEVTLWLGHGVQFESSFRCVLRDSFIHQGAWCVPGGGGYAVALEGASAEILVENNVIVKANKVMVANNGGAGSVYGYNYADDGFISGTPGWMECGLNASHFVGPHHVLFEGNYGFNFDSDYTHGNAIYHTVFRNWLRGIRRPFTDIADGARIDDVANQAGPARCIGALGYSYWMTFVGNVLGAQGRMTGWVYDNDSIFAPPTIWRLGWNDVEPYTPDPQVRATAVRDGNWDWVQSRQSWHNSPAVPLQDSLYLTGKPAFFGDRVWPWVEPTTGATYTLPAKARYEAILSAAATTYAAWREINFDGAALADDAVSGPLADPDGAGLTNLARYAFDLPPRGPASAALVAGTTTVANSTFATLTFPRRAAADGLTYTLESSPDLITWTAVPGQTFAPGTPTRVTAQDSGALGTGGSARRFLRLRVTAP